MIKNNTGQSSLIEIRLRSNDFLVKLKKKYSKLELKCFTLITNKKK